MNQRHPNAHWASGDPYEHFMGRWSRRVAHHFLTWLSIPSQSSWLDVGCGTGALSASIRTLADPLEVLAIDPSEAFARFAQQKHRRPQLSFVVGDALSIPFRSNHFDCITSGLMLNFVPDPSSVLDEMTRVARPGGVVAAYVWDYADKMEMLRYFWDAAGALDPANRILDEGVRFPICDPNRLQNLFSGNGLTQVEVRPIDIPTVFADFTDYWTPFLGGQGPAPGYVHSLDAQHRSELESSLRSALPTEADGAIALTARAWAVRGRLD